MGKEGFFVNPRALNWQSPAPEEINRAQQQPLDHVPVFLDLNWEQSSAQLGSPADEGTTDTFAIRELIGRLGTICNSGEISPPSQLNLATCGTMLNSPPKLNLSILDLHRNREEIPISENLVPFTTDPGFAERAARFSCFGGIHSLPEVGIPSRLPSIWSLKFSSTQDRDQGPPTQMEAAKVKNSREDPSASGSGAASEGSNSKKRKAGPKSRGKEASSSSSLSNTKVENSVGGETKRCKSSETEEGEKDEKELKDGGGSRSAKLPEPPRDYIHVRARRGQATDSHSLAERVRREKISERMKFLQDLVPGCSKVTGKAVMLDEIINYVQSLQRQVEFLSMKLATVNTTMDLQDMESFISKDIHQSRGLPHPFLHSFYQIGSSQHAPFSFDFNHNHGGSSSLHGAMAANCIENHSSMNALEKEAHNQIGPFWEDDLQSVVQMSFGQSPEAAFACQSFNGR